MYQYEFPFCSHCSLQNIVAPSFKIKICCSWIWFLLHLIWGGDDRFFGFVFKGERNVSYFFFIFAAYPWTRKCVFFSILIDWLRKSRVRNWNDNFLIGKKNSSENPKLHVAFQLPRNSIKNIASLFFLHDRKNFCSCDEHFSPQKVSISDGYILPIFYIANTNNDHRLS